VLFYGDQKITDFLPSFSGTVKLLEPIEYKSLINSENMQQEFYRVLNSPIGFKNSFKDLIHSTVIGTAKKLVIIVDDITRPNIHTKILLPILLNYLNELGVSSQVMIMVANGTHSMPTLDQIATKVIGLPFFHKVKKLIELHNCDKNIEYVGQTSRGTPIYINKYVLDAGLIVPLTDSEYHWFAGQAGTVKSLCPGVAGRKTIQYNHPMMFDLQIGFKESIKLGVTDGNPVIEDMKEIVSLLTKDHIIFGIDTIVNNNQIVYLQAGDLLALHHLAKEPLRELRVVPVKSEGDIVIISPGNLGLNLYQTGKAFHAGWHAVRKDGRGKIIVLAPCTEGHGNQAYYEAMLSCESLSIEEALKYCINTYCSVDSFKIGNQKPVDLLRIIKDVGEGNLSVITEMDKNILQRVFRIKALNPEGNFVSNCLKTELSTYLQNTKDVIIYLIKDPGILVEPNQINQRV